MSSITKKSITSTTKKTLPTDFTDFEEKLPSCPKCSSNEEVTKYGLRKLKSTTTQIYMCKTCEYTFTNRTIPNTPYPTPIILHALTYFNLGHTLAQTQTTMKRKYKTKIPISTLNNWVKRFEDELTFIRLRKKFDIDPNSAIHSKKFHHQQVYEFKLPEGHPSGSKNPRDSTKWHGR
jgi:transposase-like protein